MSVDSSAYNRLPVMMQGQARSVARILMQRVGAYRGSESDALTDATAIVLALRFSPEGDNHHAANLCPYCSPPDGGALGGFRKPGEPGPGEPGDASDAT